MPSTMIQSHTHTHTHKILNIYIHTHTHKRNIEYSFLCYTVDPCWFSSLYLYMSKTLPKRCSSQQHVMVRCDLIATVPISTGLKRPVLHTHHGLQRLHTWPPHLNLLLIPPGGGRTGRSERRRGSMDTLRPQSRYMTLRKLQNFLGPSCPRL